MRLWSFHPKYLDNVGLSRAINEAIGGYKALTGKQKMWQNHSQLKRFKDKKSSAAFLKEYIKYLLAVQTNRKLEEVGFQKQAIFPVAVADDKMTVTNRQLQYEWVLFCQKLYNQKGRELPEHYKHIGTPEPHPLFKVVSGDVEGWEKTKL